MHLSFYIRGSPSETKYFTPKISLNFCQNTINIGKDYQSIYPKIAQNLEEFLEIIFTYDLFASFSPELSDYRIGIP